MAQKEKGGSELFLWILTGFIVAAITIGVLIYIGWFDNNTNVDNVNVSNVEQQYQIEQAN
ncbi:MAG: hypothetical protein J6C95_06150 [Muribaculaceae bacterium]|nr:hypothetical protein [Muribaculaceae bacterium]